MIRFAIGLIATGTLLLWFLLHAWMTPGNEWIVFTIFPMMGVPYIIAVFCIWQGVTGLCIELWRLVFTENQ